MLSFDNFSCLYLLVLKLKLSGLHLIFSNHFINYSRDKCPKFLTYSYFPISFYFSSPNILYPYYILTRPVHTILSKYLDKSLTRCEPKELQYNNHFIFITFSCNIVFMFHKIALFLLTLKSRMS